MNAGLLRAAQAALPPHVSLEILSTRLPLYDGDLEAAGVPAAVQAFRDKARSSQHVSHAPRARFACCSS